MEAKDEELLLRYKAQVEKVLREMEYRDCGSAEEHRRIVDELRCPLPAIELFQYRPNTSGCIGALSKGSLLFKSPIEFNDPYDSMMRWDASRIERYFYDELYANVLSNFNLFDAESVALNISNCYRISCFSETCLSPIMWAHYANGGRGYCVGYELHPAFGERLQIGEGTDVETCECSLFPVVYSKKRFDATSALAREIEYLVAYDRGKEGDLQLDKYDKLEPYKTILFKSLDWAYEQEWRLALSGVYRNKGRDWLSVSENVTRVIFGPKVSPNDMLAMSKSLHEYAKFVGRPVMLQQIVVDWQSDQYVFGLKNCGKVPVPSE